jgi:hypothetical protein
MIDFFDKLYSSIISKNTFLDKIRFYSLLRVVIRTTANIILPVYFKLTSNNPNYVLKSTEKTEGRLIVSLTTFPARINRVWLVIETILRQTKKPDMIILWLSKEQFASKESLPKNLLRLQSRGLKVELRDNDLRSHKKYYYTLQEYPDDVMITVDDDVFYRNDLIETLFQYHNAYPHCIISNYAHKMKWINDKLAPYLNWDGGIIKECLDDDLFFGSGGGTLFPTTAFGKEVLDSSVFMSICRNADDVWLNAMCRINDTKIIKTNYYTVILPIQNVNSKDLSSSNLDSGNDKQIEAVSKYCIEQYGKNPFDVKNKL